MLPDVELIVLLGAKLMSMWKKKGNKILKHATDEKFKVPRYLWYTINIKDKAFSFSARCKPRFIISRNLFALLREHKKEKKLNKKKKS